MAAEMSNAGRSVRGATSRRVAVGAAVLLVALPLARTQFAAEFTGLASFDLTESNLRSGYGWPLASVDLWEKNYNFVAKPSERTYTVHVDGLLVDLFVSAGILIGVGWVAQRIMAGGRPQFSLRGVLFTTSCTAVCLALERETIGYLFADPVDDVELAKYFFVQVPVLLGAGCMLAAALANLSSLTTFCVRRVRATG